MSKSTTQKKVVTIETTDFPKDWTKRKIIRCLALGKTFPHHHEIPDEVNPRKANTKQPVYKAMLQTLIDEPSRFHEKNIGVYLFANVESVQFIDDERQIVTLSFLIKPPSGYLAQGHSDGRHTMMALHAPEVRQKKGIDLSKVFVPITIENKVIPTIEDRKKACDACGGSLATIAKQPILMIYALNTMLRGNLRI